jgi:hypothetical protein
LIPKTTDPFLVLSIIGNLKHTNMDFLGLFGVLKSDKMSSKERAHEQKG